MVIIIIIVTYIWNLFSIKHYWLPILIKFGLLLLTLSTWRSYKFLDTLEIKANLNSILTWLSQLEVWIVCQYVCDAQKHVHMHSK